MGLVLRSEFPVPPGPEMVADFRRHVRETGHPETWEHISTTPPPEDGEVVMLAKGIEINPKLRRTGARAPCPICLPEGEKWLHDGALIWCEATEALYCIGPDCSEGELRRKLLVARNVLAQTERERREMEALAQLARDAPAWLSWAQENRPLAASVEARHGQFAKALPKLRRTLARALKGIIPPEVLSPKDPAALLRGGAFLGGGWRLQRDLEDAGRILRALPANDAGDPAAWAEALAPTLRTQRLAEARQAVHLLRRTHQRLIAAEAFLSEPSFQTLGRWSKHPEAPTDFELSWVGASATIRHREEFWRGPLTSSSPSALPALSGELEAA